MMMISHREEQYVDASKYKKESFHELFYINSQAYVIKKNKIK